MKIVIASDHAGWELKEKIKTFLVDKKLDFKDFGPYSDVYPVDYPDYAYKVALAIKKNQYNRGILICGMGLGMAITANKVPGIRAARCHDTVSARKAQESNNAQILTLGSLLINEKLAKEVVKIWLQSEYLGKSDSKLAKIAKIEARYSK